MAIIQIQGFKCEVCGHIWIPRNKQSKQLPIVCAKCKSPNWNKFQGRNNDRLIESEHTYACIYHSKNTTLIGVEYTLLQQTSTIHYQMERNHTGIIIKLSLHLTELIRCFQSFQ